MADEIDTDEEFDTEALAQYRQFQHDYAVRRYSLILQNAIGTAESPIDFYTEATIDKYGTVTLGQWGGYFLQIMPMAFNDRLCMTPIAAPYVYDFGWCFPKGGAAALAALVWNPVTQGEPVGFIKRIGLQPRVAGETAMTQDEVPEIVKSIARMHGVDVEG